MQVLWATVDFFAAINAVWCLVRDTLFILECLEWTNGSQLSVHRQLVVFL